MIGSIRDRRITEIAAGRSPRGFPADLVRPTQRRLAALQAAERLEDLRSPPGNRLEQLSGDRVGQHSIRINAQWRICFRWGPAGPEDVEIVDYHR